MRSARSLQRPLPIRRQLPVAVGRHGGVLLAVDHQLLDHIAAEAVLAQQGRRRAARPMRTEVAHAEIDASGCAGFAVTSSLRIAWLWLCCTITQMRAAVTAVSARLDERQHLARLHGVELHVADGRADADIEPAQGLRHVAARSIEQRLVDPALGGATAAP